MALDASVAIPWLEGRDFAERDQVLSLAVSYRVVMPGVTLVEVLCGKDMPAELRKSVIEFPLLPVVQGYWRRAGLLKGSIAIRGRRARLGDALIAQACIDCDVTLLTREADFQVFAAVGGLQLYGS